MNQNIKLSIIAGLIAGVPMCLVIVFAVLFLGSGMATADSEKVTQLESEIQKQNQTINNMMSFIINQQIPFDQQVLNYTRAHQP